MIENTQALLKGKIYNIIDIPSGWGGTAEEFKTRVIEIIEKRAIGITGAPRYDIKNSDHSSTPFYPILCASSPEWGVITEQEIIELLVPKIAKQAHALCLSLIENETYSTKDAQFIAWGLEQGLFSIDLIDQICYMSGLRRDSFIKTYKNNNLIQDILADLIYPHSKIEQIEE